MKKTIISMVIAFLMCCSLCSCSQGKISEDKIEVDMNDYFCNENFTVENVTIQRSRRIEKTDTIDVAVDIKNENVSGKRSYTLIYNKYSQGGWQLDDCMPLDQWSWEAETSAPPEVSNEYLASCLFEKANKSGYVLTDKVQNPVFDLWTSMGETIETPEDYIAEVTCDFTDKRYSADVKISAESSIFGIEETIRFVWNFNRFDLKWDDPIIGSTGASCNVKVNLIGEYIKRDDPYFIPLKIISITDDGEITTVDWLKTRNFNLEGTHCAYGKADGITFFDDKFEYGSNRYVYYYEDRADLN